MKRPTLRKTAQSHLPPKGSGSAAYVNEHPLPTQADLLFLERLSFHCRTTALLKPGADPPHRPRWNDKWVTGVQRRH